MSTSAAWTFGDAIPAQIESDSGSGSGLRPGEVFEGRFKIEEVIGEGGMGRVLRATELATGRGVAIKVLRRVLNDAQKQRFAREGQLTAGFQHPGIVRVYGGGVTLPAGHPFLVLELLEDAVSLEAAWQRRPDRTLDLMLETTQAVAYAHRCGIVHRDLKPDNVLVPPDGRPRVCDFGLAWQSGVADLTKTGQLLGTPLYMAPERFEDNADLRDPSLDVWSLGVMLYLALTGEHPLKPKSGNLLELVSLAANKRIKPPSALASGVSPAVDGVCLRALSRDPVDRYADASEMADALEAAMLASPRAGGSTALAWFGAVAGLIALVVSAAAWWSEPDPQPATASATATPTPTPTRVPKTAAPAPTVSAEPLPASDPAAARAGLADLVRLALVPKRFDAELVRRFRALAIRARDDADLLDRIELERLDYLFRRGRWPDVIEPLRAFAARPAGDFGDRAAILLGMSLYELERRDDGASACRRRRIKARADTDGSRTVAAWEHVLARQPEAALRLTQTVLKTSPSMPEALLAAACAHGLLFQLEQSRKYLVRLRPHAPDHPTRYRLEVAVAIHMRERPRATTLMKELIELLEPRPNPTVLLDYAALIYSGRTEKRAVLPALKVIDRVLRQNPRHLRGRFIQAVFRFEGGIRPQEQLEQLRRLRSTHPRRFEECMSMVDPKPFRRRIRELLDR